MSWSILVHFVVNIDEIKEEFGLLERKYDSDEAGQEKGQWRRFEKLVRNLNENSAKGESVKVLFLGRHGQGFHNVAESKYGTKAWDVGRPHLP